MSDGFHITQRSSTRRNQLRSPGRSGPSILEHWLWYVSVVRRIGHRQIAQRPCRQVQIHDQYRGHLGAHVHDLGQGNKPGSGLVDLRENDFYIIGFGAPQEASQG